MRRINSYADDPRAVGTIQRYNDMIANNDQYLRNVERDRLIVDATDTALQNISDVLADVRVIALRESSAIATDQSQETSVIEVDNLMNRMMDVLNTQIEGNYIFSGHRTDTVPFERSGDSVIYQGDDNIMTKPHRAQHDDAGQHPRQHIHGNAERHPGWYGEPAAAPGQHDPAVGHQLGRRLDRRNDLDHRRAGQQLPGGPEQLHDDRRRDLDDQHRHRRRRDRRPERGRIGTGAERHRADHHRRLGRRQCRDGSGPDPGQATAAS